MTIWTKLMTALRGGLNEAGEAVVDSQALRILDQEVRDASEELKQAKDSLASIIARQKVGEEKIKTLAASIATHEGYAEKALAQGEEGLALEVAQKISDFEVQLKEDQDVVEGYAAQVQQLRDVISKTERTLKRLKQQVDTVKANESVLRAQEAVAKRHGGSTSRMQTAMDSLERIKDRQAMKSATMAAAAEMAQESGDESLHEKLEKAGISGNQASAEEVLERIKARKK